MEIVRRHILKRKDGVRVDLHYKPVKNIKDALRVNEELFNTLMNGHHKPPNPEDFYMQEIEITYREVDQSERDDESLPEDQSCHEGHSVSTKR